MLRPTLRSVRIVLVALVLLSTVACDQASKRWARSSLSESSLPAGAGHVQLILAENRGAFLSIGSHLSPSTRAVLFGVGLALALIGGVVWLFAHEQALSHAGAYSLVIGGGIGNVIDRIFRSGAVTDFIFVRFGPVRTGIFNVADICITAGVVALLLIRVSLRNPPASGTRSSDSAAGASNGTAG
jgi:signal peptidase II